MELYPDLPELTVDEAVRLWMTPRDVCSLAMIRDPAASPSTKKMLNNISDRGHIPCVKSGTAKTSARLYSLKSAIMLRVFDDLVSCGRTYAYTLPVAEMAGNLLVDAVAQVSRKIDMHDRVVPWRIVYGGMNDGAPDFVKLTKESDPLEVLASLDASVYWAGYAVERVINGYDSYWSRDLAARGLLPPSDAPTIGVDGWPVESDQ